MFWVTIYPPAIFPLKQIHFFLVVNEPHFHTILLTIWLCYGAVKMRMGFLNIHPSICREN